jgi:hypothetical protein
VGATELSEYQWYEFLALDRPLSAEEMAALRAISTRAEITPTRFWNEYHWGDLKADPAALLARYFDLHLYFANWGTRRLMLRLPRKAVDVQALKAYLPGDVATLTVKRDQVILDLLSETDEPEEDWFEAGHLAASLTPVRADLLAGDHRAAYLAWLLAVQGGEVDDEETEPPLPPGLKVLPAPLAALADFLRLDPNLLAAAAEASPDQTGGSDGLRAWVAALAPAEQRRWLLRAVEDPDRRIGRELRAEFQRTHRSPVAPRRTVDYLLGRADELRAQREQAAADRRARAAAAAAAKRAADLARLTERGEEAWGELERLVETSAYDAAVRLAVDLHEAAGRSGDRDGFNRRLAGLRQRYPRRRGFFDRLRRAQPSLVVEEARE